MAQPLFVLASGGTITMTAQPAGGIAPALGAEELLASVPELAQHARFSVHPYASLPGASLTLNQLCEMAAILKRQLASDVVGAIVIQGTDTIEETAFVLDLLVDSPKPVVVTGAMRGARAAGADGPGNLLAAAIVASSKLARGLGCLVVLNDEVHAARFVQKTHTTLPSAFQSPNLGPLGWVSEGRLLRLASLGRGAHLPMPLLVEEYPVALIKLVLGDDARLLPSLPSLGYRGVVIEAMGAGHVPGGWVRHVEQLCRVVPVVLCSRVSAGPVLRQTYGFSGSEMDLIRCGVIPGGHINAVKSCLLLRLALANGLSYSALTQFFQQVGNDFPPD